MSRIFLKHGNTSTFFWRQWVKLFFWGKYSYWNMVKYKKFGYMMDGLEIYFFGHLKIAGVLWAGEW